MTPQPLPPVDLDEIERLLSEATPRPWADDGDAIITEDPGEVDMERVLIADTRYFTIPRGQANAALIVALVNSAPGLIARIRELEGALEAIMVEYRAHDTVGIDVMYQLAKDALDPVRGAEPRRRAGGRTAGANPATGAKPFKGGQ